MKPLPDNPPPNQDDLLADFADLINKDNTAEFDLSTDEELRGLEEMLLRLNRAFPYEPLNEDITKRMHADFGIRRRRQAQQEKTSERRSWLASLFRSPLALAVSTIVLVSALFFLLPSFTGLDSSLSGAAGGQTGLFGLLIAVGIVAILFLAFWLGRRK